MKDAPSPFIRAKQLRTTTLNAHYANAKTTEAEAVHIPRCAVPSLWGSRNGVTLGSSGNGKSSMLISLLLGPYRGNGSREWVCSPSARPGIDSLWDLWRSYAQEQTDWGNEEAIFYDLSPETLETLTGLVETHGKINALLKNKGNASCTQHALYLMIWQIRLNCTPARI